MCPTPKRNEEDLYREAPLIEEEELELLLPIEMPEALPPAGIVGRRRSPSPYAHVRHLSSSTDDSTCSNWSISTYDGSIDGAIIIESEESEEEQAELEFSPSWLFGSSSVPGDEDGTLLDPNWLYPTTSP